MRNGKNKSPLLAAGVLIGAGMGGFVDGIVFHQILQIHNLLSARIPPDNLVNAKINMFWDGVFHAAVWTMTAVGILMLWKASQRADVLQSGRVLTGAILAGFGLFNLIEGIVDHQILGIHHVHEYAENKLPYDLAFLASGVALLIAGWFLIQTEKRV